jgi:ketosteroid isomerase-like protein
VNARTPRHVLDEEAAALIRASRDWAAAAATGDLERILSYWADDAIVLPPDQAALIGKAAIREFVRESLATPGFSITWEPEAATVGPACDLGYLVERNRLAFPDASGNVRTQHGKAVTVWRKDPSGAWKCVIDIWNGSPTERVLPRA